MRTWKRHIEKEGLIVHVRTTKKGCALVDFGVRLTSGSAWYYDLHASLTPVVSRSAPRTLSQAVGTIRELLEESPHTVRRVAGAPTCQKRARIYNMIAARLGVEYHNRGKYKGKQK